MQPTPLERREFLRIGALGALGAALITVPVTHCRASSGAPPLRILYFTDVHAHSGADVPAALLRAADALRSVEADVVICGGDAVHGGFQGTREEMEPRYEVYGSFLERLGRPVVHVLGNHDLVAAVQPDGSVSRGDPAAIWRARLGGEGPAYRSFDVLGWHFVVLESVEPVGGAAGYRGFIGAEQMAWLRRDLESVPVDRPIVVATHIPLRTTFSQITQGATAAIAPRLIVENAREVLSLFEGRDLRLVLQGHLHVDELIRFNRTTFYMGGAVCGAWWRGPSHGTPEGFATVAIEGDAAPVVNYRTYARTASA